MIPYPSQAIARQVMSDKAWAYYSSAADDEITNRENHAAYHRQVAISLRSSFPLQFLFLEYGLDRGYFETSPKLTGQLIYWDIAQACPST